MMRTRTHIVVLLLIVLSISCSLITPQGDSAEAPPTSPPEADAIELAPTDAPPAIAATDVTPTAVALEVVGEEEVVFDWTTDRCANLGMPDLPSRAFRDANGQVNLIISNIVAYRMVGPDLNSVTSDCNAITQSAHDADPALFTDNEWLGSIYTEDGQTIYGLVHNEYQGHTHPGMCPQNDYFACWYNSITMVVSTDAGNTFTHMADPPQHYVASLPFPFAAGEGATGLRGPSNIIKGPDGYYYSYLNAASVRSESQWVCLMRTNNLSDPASWRFWDGQGFEGRFINPYTESPENPGAHQCQPLDQADIGHALNDSITYNTALNRYVLIGLSASQIGGREVWGFYYAFSDDLIDWSRRKLLVEMPLPWTVANPGSDLSYLYPSLLDPDSESRSFETTDLGAYLYYTRNNFGHASVDRDLVRVPVEFTVTELD